MENVLRILTLYKQHYLSKYSKDYDEWLYSTLGYYDGMEIQEVKKYTASRLAFTNSKNADLTDLWYKIAENVLEGEGAYGQQNISLLKFGNRNILSKDHSFWADTSAFLCATFIQINHESDINSTAEKIERYMNRTADITAIIYRTLDNADAVLFIKSKQYQKIISAIESLGNMSDIFYTHSVLGISQECLNRIKSGRDAADLYDESETIDEMVLEIVSRGLNKAAEYIEKVNETGTYSYVLGHSDVIFRANNINMTRILKKLTDNGSLNHNNGFYGEDIYNVETILKSKKLSFEQKSMDSSSSVAVAAGKNTQSWCKGKIKELKKDLDYIKMQKDERLYSYYQAMIQSLNMLTQYEMSQFSKTIFYMVFPSLELFHDQFKKKLKPGNKLQFKELNKVKSSITRYLEAVDTIILHTVHTDQNFLMVPGYSGVLYDIPTQLCFSYMAFLGLLIDCLNDTDGGRYECFLVPTLQVNTETRFIGFDLSPTNRLIQVTIPQRILFMQRSTLMTLSHEAAHYVGDKTRNRELRLDKMIRIFAYIMSEYVYNKLISESAGNPEEERQQLIQLVLSQQEQVTIYLTKKIHAVLKRHLHLENDSEKFHWHILELYISKVCDSVILDMDHELRDIIRTIPQEGLKLLVKENNHDLLLCLENIFNEVEQRLREWVSGGLSEQMTRIIAYGISEMYSDVVSVLVLNVKWQHYIEAYLVGEGCLIRNLSGPNSTLSLDSLTENRIAVVVDTITDIELEAMQNKGTRKNSSWDAFLESIRSQNQDDIYEIAMAIDKRIKNEHSAVQIQNTHQMPEDIPPVHERESMKDELEDIIYSIDAVWKHEKEYLKKCVGDIKSQLDFNTGNNEDDKVRKKYLNLLRQYYLNFAAEDNSTGFLKSMDRLNKEYMDLIRQRYTAAVFEMNESKT